MRISIATTLTILGLAGAAGAVDITSCGDVVPVAETGVLINDLSCPTAGPAVTVEHMGTLQMGDHTIAGGSVGVDCTGMRCTVEGARGLIQGADPIGDTQAGIRFVRRAHVDNVEIRNVGIGIEGADGRLDIINSIIDGCVGHCIKTRVVVAEDLAVENAGEDGIHTKRFRTDEEDGGVFVYFSGGNGITATRSFRGLNIESQENGADGIASRKVKGEEINTSSNGGAGIRAVRGPKVRFLSSESNQGPGVVSTEGGGRFVDANLENNELATQPEGAGVDLLTQKAPKVIDEEGMPAPDTCDHSASIDTAVPWGVCEFD